MSDKWELISGGLVNIILGALILWVGQTTFQHAGQLASLDERFEAVDQQFVDVASQQESLRRWLEKVVAGVKESNQMQLTTKDGLQFNKQLDALHEFAANLERQFTQRLNSLEVKLATLETRHTHAQELAILRDEVVQLRMALSQPIDASASGYRSGDRMAAGTQVYAPQTGVTR